MNIQKFLDRTNTNASSLAESLGLNASSITSWKKGKTTPSYDICLKLLELGIGIDELFTPEIWQMVKERHAEEFRGEVVLSPEECAAIVRNGLNSLRLKGDSSEAP